VQFEDNTMVRDYPRMRAGRGAKLAEKSCLAIQASAFKLAGTCIGTRKLLARR
jgi:hypothetical protein